MRVVKEITIKVEKMEEEEEKKKQLIINLIELAKKSAPIIAGSLIFIGASKT